MKTLVELFSNEPILNLLATRIFKPQKLILVCDEKINKQNINTINIVLNNWNLSFINTQAIYTNSADYNDIFNTLEKICQTEDDIVFDLAGGSELMLFACGVLTKKYNSKSYYINTHDLAFHNVNNCEYLNEKYILPRFRVKDILASAGAKITGYYKYRPSKRDTEIGDDILASWDILWKHPNAWTNQISWFQQALRQSPAEKVTYSAQKHLKIDHANMTILNKLKDIGVLTELYEHNGTIHLTFKNAELKHCFTVQGIWLELYGFLNAYRLNWFNDVKTSVKIGWTNDYERNDETKNEIDILLVKGITPIFVSCKMGMPSALALSEIKTLSTRFGGVLAKTVVLTAKDVCSGSMAIYNRAKELNIYIIDKKDIDNNNVAKRLMEIATTFN